MTLPGLIVGVVMGFITLIALIIPFVQNRRGNNRNDSDSLKRDELLTSYERVLATIRDLDEDHQTGKITDDSYQAERTYWTEHGIELLQKLEPDAEISRDISPEAMEKPSSQEDSALDETIEKAIADYRGVKA